MMTGFHADRLTGLGGSDLGVILGLSRWRTPFELWQEKTGRSQPNVNSLQTRFGSYAEAFVADEYTAATGQRVQRYNTMLRHPTAPLIGHIDRLVIPDHAKVAAHRREIRTDTLLECKTASAFAAGRDSEWGEHGTDQVPPGYLVQCAAYLALTGCAQADLAVLFGNHEFRIYRIRRDRDLEAMLLESARRWWHDHVERDTPPDPATEAEARQRWSAHRPGTALEVDAALLQVIRELSVVKASLRTLEADEQRLKDRLVPALADAERVTHEGRDLLTYRANRPSRKTDWKALGEALLADYSDELREEIVREHTHTQPGARVLRLHWSAS